MSVAKVGVVVCAALAGCSAILDFSSSPTGGSDGAAVDATAERDGNDPGIPDAPAQTADASRVDASPTCREPPLGTDLADRDTGNCYVFFESFGQSYVDARLGCESIGGHIAVVSTRAEFELLLPRLLAATYWLGFDDLTEEGTFTWAAAEGATFTNWRAGEPNDGNGGEDCAVMYGNYTGEFEAYVGGWNDVDCTRGMYTICEQPKE